MQTEVNDNETVQVETTESTGVKTNKWRFLSILTLLLFPLSVMLNVYLLGGFGNREVKKRVAGETKDSIIGKLKRENHQLKENMAVLQPQNLTPDGIYFEVQLGAFQNFNLDQYLTEMAEIRQEKHDDKNKLLLGRFTDLNKALRFENDLKRIGVTGAFIVGRIDGELVKKEVAIQAMRERNN